MARAVEANRTLLAARSARAIDVAGIQAAGQRPNPEVGFEASRETPHWAFTGAVPLEISGKRQRRIDVANATLAVTEAETARITADVRADVRRAYYQAVGADRRVAIAQELESDPAAGARCRAGSLPDRRRAHGSRRCRPAWRCRRRRTKSRPRAATSSRRAPI